jgi:hypothetical protein
LSQWRNKEAGGEGCRENPTQEVAGSSPASSITRCQYQNEKSCKSVYSGVPIACRRNWSSNRRIAVSWTYQSESSEGLVLGGALIAYDSSGHPDFPRLCERMMLDAHEIRRLIERTTADSLLGGGGFYDR